MNKKGAIEMSMSTIIVIILSIVFLIMGLMFIKNISCNALEGIHVINDATKEQLKNLFVDGNEKIVIKDKFNEIQRELSYGVAFLIRNTGTPTTDFSYTIEAIDLGTCSFNKQTAESFMVLGKKTDSITIPTDSDYAGLIKFQIPSSTPNCELKYQIKVKNNNVDYVAADFTVNIKPKSFRANMC